MIKRINAHNKFVIDFVFNFRSYVFFIYNEKITIAQNMWQAGKQHNIVNYKIYEKIIVCIII